MPVLGREGNNEMAGAGNDYEARTETETETTFSQKCQLVIMQEQQCHHGQK